SDMIDDGESYTAHYCSAIADSPASASSPAPLEAHPVAAVFPRLEGQPFDELVAYIREHGLREPIVLPPDGRLLHGRNRYRACLAAGVEPRFVTWEGRGDELAYVLSKNLRRRHLSESQRAMVAARIATLGHGGDRRSGQAANLPVETQ